MALTVKITKTGSSSITASVTTSGSVAMQHNWYIDGDLEDSVQTAAGETSSTMTFTGVDMTEDHVILCRVYAFNPWRELDSGSVTYYAPEEPDEPTVTLNSVPAGGPSPLSGNCSVTLSDPDGYLNYAVNSGRYYITIFSGSDVVGGPVAITSGSSSSATISVPITLYSVKTHTLRAYLTNSSGTSLGFYSSSKSVTVTEAGKKTFYAKIWLYKNFENKSIYSDVVSATVDSSQTSAQISVPYDGSGFTADGRELLGFSLTRTDAEPTYPITGTYTVTATSTDPDSPTTVRLYAIWEITGGQVYYARLRVLPNGGSGTTQIINASVRSLTSPATIRIEFTGNDFGFTRSGYELHGFDENSTCEPGSELYWPDGDIAEIRATSTSESSPTTLTLYAIWKQVTTPPIKLEVVTIRDTTVVLRATATGLSSSSSVYQVVCGSTPAVSSYQSSYLAGPNFTHEFTMTNLSPGTTYSFTAYLFVNGSGSGYYDTVTDVTTTVPPVDAELSVERNTYATQTTSGLKGKATVTAVGSGSNLLCQLRINMSYCDQLTSDTFTLVKGGSYIYSYEFYDLPPNENYELTVVLVAYIGGTWTKIDEKTYTGTTAAYQRPNMFYWNPAIYQGKPAISTTQVTEKTYKAAFLTASEWLRFVDAIEDTAEYVGVGLSSSTLSQAKTGVTSGQPMKRTQIEAAVSLINSLSPPDSIPTIPTTITAAFFNNLASALRSIE